MGTVIDQATILAEVRGLREDFEQHAEEDRQERQAIVKELTAVKVQLSAIGGAATAVLTLVQLWLGL